MIIATTFNLQFSKTIDLYINNPIIYDGNHTNFIMVRVQVNETFAFKLKIKNTMKNCLTEMQLKLLYLKNVDT